MTTEPVISVKNLSKRYRIGAKLGKHDTLRDAVMAKITAPFRKLAGGADKSAETELWALKDVSFDVAEGEVVGVIGRNGAGKSTLLKILARITDPTEGSVKLNGRVASLLEVGTGFHPELTGRENIYLNGAILGMKRAEIKSKFDEIVAFSEIEKFLDTPVKRYSSGMYVRLAFAVAAHLDPEILLVDEVLAVGDAEFQKKCLGKMDEVAKGGRTVIFVSHNMTAIRRICERAVLIKDGLLSLDGTSSDVISRYLSLSTGKKTPGETDLSKRPDRYGNGEARILKARLLDEKEKISNVMYRSKPMHIEFEMESRSSQTIHLSLALTAEDGARILHLSHHDSPGFSPGVLKGRFAVRATIPALPLCSGGFNMVLAIHNEFLEPIDVVADALPFNVEDAADSPRPFKTETKHGYCWTPNTWSIAKLD
jgi:lipopolysaccharide transport system ATP-binding protein